MSRWNGPLARRRAVAASSRTERDEDRERSARTGPGRGPGQRPAPGAAQGPRVLVEDHDGLLLIRPSTDDTLRPADLADLARVLRAEDGGTVTIVAVAEGYATALWPRLSESLDSLREAGTRSVRLVMSGAGRDHPDRPALARRISEAWDLTVEAPDGPALVVPGGSVFVAPADGGWWRFAPERKPEKLGPRVPSPDWESAIRRAPVRTADGCVVDQIPAGLLIRPVEAAAPRPGDLFHAIPVDPRRPAVVVGVPWGEDVVATDVAELLGALPAAVRPGVRLVPGGRRDVLPLGQSVAGLLNSEVEVTTGLPLFAADGPLGTYGVRSVVVGPDGDPRWLPYVDAVMCLPPTRPGPDSQPVPEPDNSSAPGRVPAPRLLRWSSPVPDPGGADNGVVRLSDEWQATVTRAGLWVGPRDGTPLPRSLHPVSIEGPIVEVGRTGDRLDASLWPVLSRLLDRLAPDVRARTALHVHAVPPDGGHALRTLTADHALRVIRFAPPSRTPRPLPRGGAVVRASGAVGGTATVAVPHPMAVVGAAEQTAAAVSAPPAGTTPAAPALPDPPAPRRTRITASGAARPGPATPAAGSGPAPAGGPGPSEPLSSPAASLAEPTAEPVTGLVSVPPVTGLVSGPLSGALSGPLSPAEATEPAASGPAVSESASGPASAPEAPRPDPVATGAPAAPVTPAVPAALVAPVAPARRVPTAGGAAPQPSSPAGEEAPRTRADGPAVPDTAPDTIRAPGARPLAEVPGESGGSRPLPVVPVSPSHRSTAPERNSFRTLAEPVWERHSAAVNRALAGMPALRGEEQEAARIDLIALRMYLRNGEGPLSHEELTSSLRAGEQRLVPYAGCLASGLGRLPSYRGAVLRGWGGADGHGKLRPGAVLRDPAPLSGLPLDPARKARVAGVGFAIWSITGCRVRQLLDGDDEIVFAPGTTFRVLDVRTNGAVPLVLLRQLPESHAASNVLEGADESALARLDHALIDRMAPGTGDWPGRCAGPIGDR
ncbi:hypothetical protein [Streptomyces sp. NPDC096311]|uniref:hypothetical protein n=1 Tax=Streptomyces sp. NPDC096311 TaxID=3366083 RepID=UPI0037F871A5